MQNIQIYDDIFPYTYRSKLYKDVLARDYNIGWADTNIIEHRDKVFMFSLWKTPEFIKSNFLTKIKNNDLLKKINNRLPSKVVVNCSTFGDVYLPHVHNEKEVLLYYVNLDWKREWYGETEFYSDDLKETILSNPYVPGRVVWFSGKVPHSVKPQSHLGPKFRFSISLFFDTNYMFV